MTGPHVGRIVGGFWFTATAGDIVPLPVIVLVSGIGILTGSLAAIPLLADTRRSLPS